jgi:hypothetical protein
VRRLMSLSAISRTRVREAAVFGPVQAGVNQRCLDAGICPRGRWVCGTSVAVSLVMARSAGSGGNFPHEVVPGRFVFSCGDWCQVPSHKARDWTSLVRRGWRSGSAWCASWMLMLTCLLARPGTPWPAGSLVSGIGGEPALAPRDIGFVGNGLAEHSGNQGGEEVDGFV